MGGSREEGLAAWGCSTHGLRKLFLAELLLRGADRLREEALSGGAAAARGCPIGGRKLFLAELPLRGAARLEGGSSFWGSCRCAGLLDWREGALSGGAAAARGCSIEGGSKLFLGGLPLRGAAQLEGGSSFWRSCCCAGLLD